MSVTANTENPLLALLVENLADQVARRISEKLAGPRAVEKKLFTVKEAAIYMGRSESSVRHLIDHRELPVVKNGTRVHVLKSDMDEWIDDRRS